MIENIFCQFLALASNLENISGLSINLLEQQNVKTVNNAIYKTFSLLFTVIFLPIHVGSSVLLASITATMLSNAFLLSSSFWKVDLG